MTQSTRPKLNTTFLGQALIEYDPQRYYNQPLSDIATILENQDLILTNLEGCICGEDFDCQRTRFDQYFHGTDPSVLDFLQSIRLNFLSLANNHAWDFGDEGIKSTIQEAKQRNFIVAGTGENLAGAKAVGFTTINGWQIALIGMVTLDTTEHAHATETTPGYYRVYKNDASSMKEVIQLVEEATSQTEMVILHHHYHHHQEPDDLDWQQMFAHQMIEAGASVYVGHGEPTLKGIELYQNKPIFYGLGNFIFHTRAPIGQYDEIVWEGVICQVVFNDKSFETITLIPVVLNEGEDGPLFLEKRGYPSLADTERGDKILRRLQSLSKPYGTTLSLENGQGHILRAT